MWLYVLIVSVVCVAGALVRVRSGDNRYVAVCAYRQFVCVTGAQEHQSHSHSGQGFKWLVC